MCPRLPVSVACLAMLFVITPAALFAETYHVIADSLDFPMEVHAIDFDRDGDTDIITSEADARRILWFENLGDETFADHVICDDPEGGTIYLSAADVDGDGDTDIISGHHNSGQIRLWQNNGDETFLELNIAYLNLIRGLDIYDMDSDGDYDVVAFAHTSTTDLVWWENQNGNFFFRQIVDRPIISEDIPVGLALVDFDSDGDGDIVFSESGLHQNDVKGLFIYLQEDSFSFDEYQISSEIHNKVHVDDIDQDGDYDILTLVSTSILTNDVGWYENIGNLNFTWHQIFDISANSYFSIDYDLDGDQDVFVADAPLMFWNDGANNFDTYTNFLPGEFGLGLTLDICPARFDTDLRPDIVATCQQPMNLKWMKNETAPDPLVSLSVHAENAPIILPPEGDSFTWSATITKYFNEPVNGYAWCVITSPNGEHHRQFTRSVTLQPGDPVTITGLQQQIPAAAPPGDYLFSVRLGVPPDNIMAEGHFLFHKQ